MEAYADLFREHRHLVLAEMLGEPLRSIVHQYSLKRALHSPETSWGSLLRGTPVFYGDPLAETLLELFEQTATEFSGTSLDLAFAELFVYGRSAAANPQLARDAAEVRLTIYVGSESGDPWPLLIDIDGSTTVVELGPGDALLHRPSSDPVARPMLADGHVVELQLNFVDRDGPHAALRFDGREEIGGLPSIRDQPSASAPLRRHGYVHEIFDDEILVHYPDDGLTFALNLTAGLVWAQCDGESTADAICERLRAAYPDAPTSLDGDVEAALSELRLLGALEP